MVGGIQVPGFVSSSQFEEATDRETSSLPKSSQWKRNMNSKLGTRNSEPVYANRFTLVNRGTSLH